MNKITSQKQLRRTIIKQLPSLGVSLLIGSVFYILFFTLLSNFQDSCIPNGVLMSSYDRTGSILMFIPILYPSFFLGIMIRQFFEWHIPATRKKWETAYKEEKTTFKKNMHGHLLNIFISLLIISPFALLGTQNYFYVTEKGIYHNPSFHFRRNTTGGGISTK